MWNEEGFKGLLRGNGINCLRIVPYSAVQFTTYEQLKKVRMTGSFVKNYPVNIVDLVVYERWRETVRHTDTISEWCIGWNHLRLCVKFPIY